MNKTAALEWLRISFHDLKSAQILYDANHYTDSIGSDLQQSIEKSMKSILAYKNSKIPKTHDLYELYDLIDELDFDEDFIDLLHIATEYYKEDRYPNPSYSLPSRDEIKDVLDLAQMILENSCVKLNINVKDVEA